MTRFPYQTEIDVRYSDLDSLGHVNNAVYATYLELARLRYLEAALAVDAANPEFVIAHLELDFLTPVTDVGTVEVGVGVVDVGRTSFRVACEIRSGDTVAARGESTQVTVEDGRPVTIPDQWRETLLAERDRTELEAEP